MNSWTLIACMVLGAGMAFAQNLVVNGDFEAGNTSFESDYGYDPPDGWLAGGFYSVSDSPSDAHEPLAGFADHTGGNGLMMVVNGQYTGEVQACWKQSVSVSPGVEYAFSFWGATAYSGPRGEVGLYVNGIRIEPTFILPEGIGVWEKHSTTWSNRSGHVAELEIRVLSTTDTGNDFALDDVTFRSVGDTEFLVPGEFPIGIDKGLAYSIQTTTGRSYRLVGRATPFDQDWVPITEFVTGTGEEIFGFERGTNNVFLPSRAWETSNPSDGWSLAFDGVDDFAYVGHADVLNVSTSMTLEAWIKPGQNPSGGMIVAKAISYTVMCYSLEQDPTGHIVLHLQDASGSQPVNLRSTSAVSTGVWSHVAATYDGAFASLFINGQLNQTASAPPSLRISTISPFGIGGILGAMSFSGSIDEVTVWDYARSATELREACAGEFQDAAGLVGRWSLSETNGQIAADSGPQGLNLTLGESAGASATDPVWQNDSCSGFSTYETIWEFGKPTPLVYWKSQFGASYVVQAVDQLGQSWQDIGSWMSGSGHELEFFASPAKPFGYHRVVANGLIPGLIAYYPLDGNTDDASGNGHNGTAVDVATIPDGISGGAYSFNGSSSYIRIPDHPDLNPDVFTVSVWVNKDSASADGGAFGKLVHGGPSGHRILLEADGNVRFSMIANGNLLPAAAMRVPFSAYFGDWTMVTYSYSGTSAKQYINGQLAVEKAFSGGSITNPYDLLIGAGAVDYDGVTPMQMFRGDIDEVRFYNRVLSAEEIEALYLSDAL